MLFSHFTSAFALQALFRTFPSASAQTNDFNSSNYDNCSPKTIEFAPNAPVNSTGKVEFTLSKAGDNLNKTAWYMSVTLNETRHDSNKTVQTWFQSWLSAPAVASGYACVYQFGGVNASSRGTGLNGCDGVLSSACIAALGNITSTTSTRCPPFRPTDETRKHCGDEVLRTIGVKGPFSVSNDTCTIPSPQHVSIPSGYRSIPMMGWGPWNSDSSSSSFDWYDVNVQQPIPWVIAPTLKPYRDSDEVRDVIEVVCVTPNSVVDGSRKPTLQFKPKDDNPNTPSPTSPNPNTKTNTSQASNWRTQACLAIFIAGISCLMMIV